MTSIIADVLKSVHFDSILHCEKFEILLIDFLWACSFHIFSLAKLASEVQKPLAKMEFLLVGYR